MSNQITSIPKHVAIIPDGNRRWAKNNGLKPWEGHEEGAKNTEKLVRFALENGIDCITFWGSSLDNLTKRPLRERQALLDIYSRYFEKLIGGKEIHEQEARINIIGRWEEQLPESLKKILKEGIEKTKNYKKKILNFMLAYDGDDEMIRAIQNIIDNCEKGMEITAEVVKENLMTKDIPAVDYLIRTGGEPHLSAGFMMWDTADAQLYFSEKMYPDFGTSEFQEALEEYARRQRRFGV
ncbi:MAG: polyprenyl diphosphate synthase [Parcubacteria group bacterium]|jgi:undecaprenyl diphosphate synthase